MIHDTLNAHLSSYLLDTTLATTTSQSYLGRNSSIQIRLDTPVAIEAWRQASRLVYRISATDKYVDRGAQF